jgi:octaprenyl-diphosphate synthase
MTTSENKLSAKEKIKLAMDGLSEMKSVESVIRSKLVSDAQLLVDIPEYLLNLGGKRMRPLLTILCAKALGMQEVSKPVIDVSAGIELIHMATLLHDDIIDNSSLRRHKESAFVKYGLGDSLLAGDFLLVRAFSLCATLDPAIISATEIACIHLTEGEILEVPLHVKNHSVDTSITIAKKKTAALFKLAAFSGAFLCQTNEEVTKHFSNFGENLGIAFQILDDILDVTSSEDLLGKPSGTDLKERKPALVNILWLESGSPLAQRLKTKPNETENEFVKNALEELRRPNNPVLEKARSIAIQYAQNAKSDLELALQHANASSADLYKKALYALIDYTLERVQ